jgi:hypothetical protein
MCIWLAIIYLVYLLSIGTEWRVPTFLNRLLVSRCVQTLSLNSKCHTTQLSRTTTQIIVMVMRREPTGLSALWPWGQLSLYLKWVPGVFPMGKGGRCIGLTTLPPSYADSFEIWEPGPPGTLRTCPSLYRDCFTFTFCLVGCRLVAC